ncbi:MAG: trehalose-phosphatase [Cyclobacteriaceae bacterium]
MRYHDLPELTSNIDSFFKKLEKQQLALFLDYDGTLTPIVNKPEDAKISAEMRQAVYDLSTLIPVAVISGRDRKDVEKMVGLKNLIYSGSHGFDSKGPDFEYQHEAGVNCLPEFDAAEQELNSALSEIENAKVERKLFAIAIHYRNVKESEIAKVEEVTNNIYTRYDCFKKAGGKKIIELKPDIDWHKGKALLWLLEKLDLKKPEILPVYIGDDVTDEDAFKALPEVDGLGILVGDHEMETKANYRLENVEQVKEFLHQLIKHYQDKPE